MLVLRSGTSKDVVLVPAKTTAEVEFVPTIRAERCFTVISRITWIEAS
jgi:hypothetical protein